MRSLVTEEPNNKFTGRGRVNVIKRPPDGHAPVQWMLDVLVNYTNDVVGFINVPLGVATI